MGKTRVAYFDIDLTLVGFGLKSISQASRHALLNIPKRGVNTLRNIEDAKQPFREGDLNLPYITLNGAQVWDIAGKLIYSLSIDRGSIDKLISGLANAGEHIVEMKAYSSTEKLVLIYAKTYERGVELLAEYPSTMPKMLIENTNDLTSLFRTREFSYIGIRFDNTFDNFLPTDLGMAGYKLSKGRTKISIYPGEASKVNTLKWVCKNVLKISPADVLTVGDDYEMDGEVFAETVGVSVGEEKHPLAKHHTTFDNLPDLLLEMFNG